ncbi:MAG: haloalkane dehalogenase [Gammaproteobacteria bacterium]|nr:MAG: haloalkane dehalogenase [Gammaproteobacteria bacterium]
MKLLRTPEERFSAVPDFPYAPAYTQLDEIRMAHVEAGDGPVVLMLHGEPTWSFLYRKMIPVFAGAGFRAVAPDLVGFGRSDKPARLEDYSYAGHVAWMLEWLEKNELEDITLVCQDWGSLIGLRLAAEHPHRFSRIAVANGFLPIADRPAPIAFKAWRTFARYAPVFPTGRIVQAGTVGKLSAEAVAAYDAPFPSEKYKAGARAFPRLVPTSPDDPAVPANRAAWKALGNWDRPFLTAFGKKDPILGWADKLLQRHVPGAKGQPHRDLENASHFVQEDAGEELAEIVVEWCRGTAG